MKMRTIVSASAALGLLAAASAANAAVTVQMPLVADDLNGATLGAHGQVMLEDFDAISNANTAFVGNEVTTTPNPISNSAPPPYSGGVVVGGASVPVDDTDYASVQGGNTSTFTALGGYALTSFSFYLGSPDTYNKVVFNFLGGGSQTFTGSSIWGGNPPGNGDRTLGYRVYYDFGGAKVKSISFSSTADAFEFDGLAGSLGVVPEPGTWALMILGFGGAGAMLRRRKAVFA